MGELKTKRTAASVSDFVESVKDEGRRRDCRDVLRLMTAITKARPRMWGASIVGFGSYRYKSASGREGDWFLTGFSPRKADLTIYVTGGFEAHQDLMDRLGKYKTGQTCLYVKKLADVDRAVLKKLLQRSVRGAGRDGRF